MSVIPTPKRIFADEKTRKVVEMAEAASKLASKLPPEGTRLEMRPIKFDSQHDSLGMTAVLVVGTVVFTGTDGTVLVPARTVRVLDQLGIPYQMPAAGAKSG